MAATATKTIHCAGCRLDTAHSTSLDKNQEIVAVCSECGRAIKFPLVDKAAFDALIANHKKSSSGQVTVEMAAKDQAKHDAAFLKAMGVS